jgi:hypothetical protein
MIKSEKFSKLTLFLVQAPAFALIVIIYGLSVSILRDTFKSASIALSQFAGDGVSLSGITNGVIVLGAINLFILIGLLTAGSFYESLSWDLLFIGLINILFNLISEAIFFKFASCYNFPSNAIVVARSSLVNLLMIIILCIALYALLFKKLDETPPKEQPVALSALLLILTSIVMFVLNLM